VTADRRDRRIALMYHDVTPPGAGDSSGFLGGDAARYKLTPRQFDDHLCAIARRTASAPLLTFDDGGASAVMIADRLEAMGWRGHFFVTAGYVDQPRFLTRAQIRDLSRRGHSIGSHSWSHPLRMARSSPDRIREEWRRSIAALSDIVGAAIVTASVPGGAYAARVGEAAADAGLRTLFVSAPLARIRQCGTLRIVGRYVVQRSTSPGRAAAVAAGAVLPRWQQLALWQIKGIGKTVAGPIYLKARERILGRSDQVRWGDEVDLSEHPS
jgi:peptidoglycan/xylan/chitin deacetylase (PgdA/CDA1 family)